MGVFVKIGFDLLKIHIIKVLIPISNFYDHVGMASNY